jgi:hypothetical protein
VGLQNGEYKEKGSMWAAHQRLKVYAAARLGGGGRRRWLRRPTARVWGEAGRRRPELEKRPVVGDWCGGGQWWPTSGAGGRCRGGR